MGQQQVQRDAMRLLLTTTLILQLVLFSNGARLVYEDQISMESRPESSSVVAAPSLSRELESIKAKMTSRRSSFGDRMKPKQSIVPQTQRVRSEEAPESAFGSTTGAELKSSSQPSRIRGSTRFRYRENAGQTNGEEVAPSLEASLPKLAKPPAPQNEKSEEVPDFRSRLKNRRRLTGTTTTTSSTTTVTTTSESSESPEMFSEETGSLANNDETVIAAEEVTSSEKPADSDEGPVAESKAELSSASEGDLHVDAAKPEEVPVSKDEEGDKQSEASEVTIFRDMIDTQKSQERLLTQPLHPERASKDLQDEDVPHRNVFHFKEESDDLPAVQMPALIPQRGSDESDHEIIDGVPVYKTAEDQSSIRGSYDAVESASAEETSSKGPLLTEEVAVNLEQNAADREADDNKEAFEIQDGFVNMKRLPVSSDDVEVNAEKEANGSGESEDQTGFDQKVNAEDRTASNDEEESSEVEDDGEPEAESRSFTEEYDEETAKSGEGVHEAVEGSRAFQRRLLDMMVSEARQMFTAVMPDRAALTTFSLFPLFKPKYKSYGKPKEKKKHKAKKPKPQYGVPKPEYGPPKPEYGPPKPAYEAPKPQYGVPKPEYGAPKPQYGTPKPEYGAPKPQYGAPKPEYGAPKPSHSAPKPTYGAPQQAHPAPKPTYGAPKPTYGPPKQEYGPPKQEYGPPKQEYGPPKQEYGPPKQEYGPPKQEYGPPKQEYGPPKQEYGPPKQEYGPPKQEYGPPKQQYGPPKQEQDLGARPPKSNYGAPNPAPQPQHTPIAPPSNGVVIYPIPPPAPSYPERPAANYKPPLPAQPAQGPPPPNQPSYSPEAPRTPQAPQQYPQVPQPPQNHIAPPQPQPNQAQYGQTAAPVPQYPPSLPEQSQYAPPQTQQSQYPQNAPQQPQNPQGQPGGPGQSDLAIFPPNSFNLSPPDFASGDAGTNQPAKAFGENAEGFGSAVDLGNQGQTGVPQFGVPPQTSGFPSQEQVALLNEGQPGRAPYTSGPGAAVPPGQFGPLAGAGQNPSGVPAVPQPAFGLLPPANQPQDPTGLLPSPGVGNQGYGPPQAPIAPRPINGVQQLPPGPSVPVQPSVPSYAPQEPLLQPQGQNPFGPQQLSPADEEHSEPEPSPEWNPFGAFPGSSESNYPQQQKETPDQFEGPLQQQHQFEENKPLFDQEQNIPFQGPHPEVGSQQQPESIPPQYHTGPQQSYQEFPASGPTTTAPQEEPPVYVAQKNYGQKIPNFPGFPQSPLPLEGEGKGIDEQPPTVQTLPPTQGRPTPYNRYAGYKRKTTTAPTTAAPQTTTTGAPYRPTTIRPIPSRLPTAPQAYTRPTTAPTTVPTTPVYNRPTAAPTTAPAFNRPTTAPPAYRRPTGAPAYTRPTTTAPTTAHPFTTPAPFAPMAEEQDFTFNFQPELMNHQGVQPYQLFQDEQPDTANGQDPSQGSFQQEQQYGYQQQQLPRAPQPSISQDFAPEQQFTMQDETQPESGFPQAELGAFPQQPDAEQQDQEQQTLPQQEQSNEDQQQFGFLNDQQTYQPQAGATGMDWPKFNSEGFPAGRDSAPGFDFKIDSFFKDSAWSSQDFLASYGDQQARENSAPSGGESMNPDTANDSDSDSMVPNNEAKPTTIRPLGNYQQSAQASEGQLADPMESEPVQIQRKSSQASQGEAGYGKRKRNRLTTRRRTDQQTSV